MEAAQNSLSIFANMTARILTPGLHRGTPVRPLGRVLNQETTSQVPPRVLN